MDSASDVHGWIGAANALVQSPFALAVLLLVLFAVMAYAFFRANERWRRELRAEIAECWGEHRRANECVLILTGFLAEALSMAGHLWGLEKSRRAEDRENLDDLERRVEQFRSQEQRDIDRDRVQRRAMRDA